MMKTNDTLNILHLEDNSADAELIRVVLEDAFENCHIFQAQDRVSFENLLYAKNDYHIILSDYNVPGLQGLECLELTQKTNLRAPFIYVTGAIGEEGAVEVLKKGATDYVLKNKLQKLPLAIKRAMREINDRILLEEKGRELKASNSFKASVIHAIKAHIIVIDANGEIIETNDAWKHFVKDYSDQFNPEALVQNNYFVLLTEMLQGTQCAEKIMEGISVVIDRNKTKYQHEFEFHNGQEKMCFTLEVSQRLDKKGAVITHTNTTDRFLSAMKLRKNEEEFRSLAQNAPNLIIKLNQNLEIEFINRGVIGLSPEKMIGRKGIDFVAAENREYVQSVFNKILEDGQSTFYMTSRTLPDGKVVHNRTNVGPILNEEGKVESFILIIQNITEEVTNQEKVSRQNKELIYLDAINQTGLDSSKGIDDLIEQCMTIFPKIIPVKDQRFLFIDRTSETVSTGDRMLEAYLNVEPLQDLQTPQFRKALKKQRIFSTNHPDEISKLMEEYQKCTGVELKNWSSSASLMLVPLFIQDELFGVFLITSKTVISDEDERTLKPLINLAQTVLLKKRTEHQLVQNERKYRELFETVREGFVKISDLGIIRIINEPFSEIMGYEREELIGVNVEDLFKLSTDEMYVNEQTKQHEFDLELQKKSGERFWAHLSISPQFTSSGRFAGAALIVRNITHTKLVSAWSSITANIARKITTEETSVQKVFELTHQELKKYMPAQNFFGVLREDVNSIEILYFNDERTQLEVPSIRKSGNGLTEHVLGTGEAIWLRGDELESFETSKNVTIFGDIPKSCIAAPLFMDDMAIGVIACTSYDDVNAYQKFHFSILEYVGKQLGIFIDKIEATEDRNRIITLSEDLICIVNSEGNLSYANPAFENQLGYTQSELQQIKATDLIAPEDELIRNMILRNLKSGNQTFKFQSRMKSKKGEVIYVSWTAVSQEKDRLFYCSGRNISEQHLIQQQIEASERRYRGLYERMNEGIIHSDASGQIISVNPGLCKILGYTEEELIGQNAYKKLHQPDVAKSLIKKVEYRKNGIPGSYETRFLRKNGEEIWTQVSVTPDYDASGNFTGLMTIIMDVNERKRAEMEAVAIKEAFTRELEDKVNERTMELENARAKLTKSLEKEKELSRLKSRFVSTASHQFRTPLSVIQSSIGILALHMENISDSTDLHMFREKFDTVYSRIKDQIERMTDLMNDVLVLGKINEGNLTVRLHDCSLVQLCNAVIRNFDDDFGTNRIKFKVIGKERPIKTDKQLFCHALSNLASNAIKYTPDNRPPEIELSYGEQVVEIIVRDQGIGIPQEELQHLFEPFYRASNAKDYTGTGLGTSITKEYIELIGGHIDVESTVGKGTQFTIQIKN